MRLDENGLRRFRRGLWVILLVIALLFSAASVLSATNYTDIAYAKLAVEANATIAMSADGLGPSEEILTSTVFHYHAVVNVSNPSPREIDLQTITYECKLRDYLYEDEMGANGTWKAYYSVLVKEFNYSADTGSISSNSVRTYDVIWTLSMSTSPATFPGMQRILNYTLTHGQRRWQDAEWQHYFVYLLIVTGVPLQYYGQNSGYLIELPVIHREQLIVTGAGP